MHVSPPKTVTPLSSSVQGFVKDPDAEQLLFFYTCRVSLIRKPSVCVLGVYLCSLCKAVLGVAFHICSPFQGGGGGVALDHHSIQICVYL